MNENLSLEEIQEIFEPFLTVKINGEKYLKVFSFQVFLQALVGDEEVEFFLDDKNSIAKACEFIEDKYPFLFKFRKCK